VGVGATCVAALGLKKGNIPSGQDGKAQNKE